MQIYQSMNDFIAYLRNLFCNLSQWKKIDNPSPLLREFLSNITNDVGGGKKDAVSIYKLNRCSPQYAFFASLSIAKYIGLYPYFDECPWTLPSQQSSEPNQSYVLYNVFEWILDVLKRKTFVEEEDNVHCAAQAPVGDSLLEVDAQYNVTLDCDEENIVGTYFSVDHEEVMSSSGAGKELPVELFISTVLRQFVTLFIEEIDEDSSDCFPWTFQEFIEQNCHRDFCNFILKMKTEYLNESNEFFQNLLPTKKKKKKKKKNKKRDRSDNGGEQQQSRLGGREQQQRGRLGGGEQQQRGRLGGGKQQQTVTPSGGEQQHGSRPAVGTSPNDQQDASGGQQPKNLASCSNEGTVDVSTPTNSGAQTTSYVARAIEDGVAAVGAKKNDCMSQRTLQVDVASQNTVFSDCVGPTLGGVFNIGASSFFSSALQFFIQGLGEDALRCNFNVGGDCLEKFVEGGKKMMNIIEKLSNGSTLTEDDVLCTIDLSSLEFEDKYGTTYKKFTDIEDSNLVEQDVAVLIDFLVNKCWMELLLIQVFDQEIVSSITIEPTVVEVVETTTRIRSIVDKKIVQCCDLKSSLLYQQRHGREEGQFMYWTNKQYFIIKIKRIVAYRTSSSKNMEFQVDTKNILNTEAVKVPCGTNNSMGIFFGVLQSFVVTTNDMHSVTYARCKDRDNQWVLFNDEDIILDAKEGSEMTGFGYFLLYKKCTESEYKSALQRATNAKESAAKSMHNYICVYAAVHTPENTEELMMKVKQSYILLLRNKCPHLTMTTSLGRLYLDHVAFERYQDMGRSGKKVEEFIESGYRVLLRSVLLSYEESKQGGKKMIHNWWECLDDELLRVSIDSAIKENSLRPPNKGDMNKLMPMLWEKLIEYTDAPYDSNAPHMKQHGQPIFCDQCHLTVSSILNRCSYCFEY
jgi:hypothetical protein